MRQFNPSGIAFLAILILSVSATWNGRFCTAQQVNDNLELPYQALVLQDRALVHSGPGQVHYPTQRLDQGDAVEVFRHDPGGWCAIRPVAKSFSLVPESTLELVDTGVGRITEDGTRAWVGTELGAVEKPLWQVKLRKGELVEVLGQVSWPNPEGHSTLWYQIASPAGEFRWIRMTDIQPPVSTVLADLNQGYLSSIANPTNTVRSLNEIISRSPAHDTTDFSFSSEANTTRNGSAGSHEGLQTAFEFQSPSNPDSTETNMNAINGGWRQATRRINEHNPLTTSDSGFSSHRAPEDRFLESNFDVQNNPNWSVESEFAARNKTAFENGPIRVATADMAGPRFAGDLNAARSLLIAQRGVNSIQVSDLELRLTVEMLKDDPTQWQMGELESAANSILRNSTDSAERTKAEKFLIKIGNCNTIQSGYSAGPGSRSPGFGYVPTQTIGTGVGVQSELDSTYDAHGWLNKMVRNGGSTESTFVLQDATGRITHHVSPIPGLNLQRYLKARVGIIGQRGYHSQLKLDHVTAHQIVELEQSR